MVFKRLKIYQFFNAAARTFSYTQAWVSEGRQELKIFSKKDVFLVFRGETKFHHFWPPLEKRLEKSTSSPPG